MEFPPKFSEAPPVPTLAQLVLKEPRNALGGRGGAGIKAQFSKSFSFKFKNGVKGFKSIKQKTWALLIPFSHSPWLLSDSEWYTRF